MNTKKLICFNCEHFSDDVLGCKAFPEGIPNAILNGNNKHKKPLRGQKNELTFKRKKDA